MSTVKRLFLALAALAALGLGHASSAQAHQPKCHPIANPTHGFTFNGSPAVGSPWSVFQCPNSVDSVILNSIACGYVKGSVQGIFYLNNCTTNQFDPHDGFTYWDEPWRSCTNTLVHQRIWAYSNYWREHWTTSPTGGPIWTEDFVVTYPDLSATAPYFDCSLIV